MLLPPPPEEGWWGMLRTTVSKVMWVGRGSDIPDRSGPGAARSRPFFFAPCMLRVAVESAVRARQTDCPMVRAPLRDR